MPRIAEDSVREILDVADLVELVRSRTALTKRGGRWVGRCPFHDERTPSFGLIPPENRYYYCHGCGAKGTAVDWMMSKEGAGSYPEALEGLAERFGVTPRYEQSTPEEDARRRSDARRLDLLSRAAAFYGEYLWRAPEAEPARRYLSERGFDEALVRDFGIGFAPSSGRTMAQKAAAQGFAPAELVAAGLGRERRGRVEDFFVNRVTFPIADGRGRVMGFGARTLDPNQRAKYVNSPEGPRFQKRRLLFALHRARPTAARAGNVVVVEGYTDVLAFAKAGIDNVVACMGTSLTSDQVRELKRSSERISLCFDGDAAGRKAAWRSAEAAGEHIMSLDTLALGPGEDPGDMARGDEGVAALRRIYEDRTPLVTSLIGTRARDAGESPSARQQAMDGIAGLLRGVPDSVEKDEGVRLAAGLLRLSPHMEERLQAASRFGREAAPVPATVPGDEPAAPLDAETRRERGLLVRALAWADDAPPVLADVAEGVFADPAHREAFALIRDRTPTDAWPEHLSDLALALRIEGAGLPSDLAPEARVAELREASMRAQIPALERRAARLRAEGDERGRLATLDLMRRLRGALRGAE